MKKSPAPINGYNLFFKPNLEEHTKVAIYVSKQINASIISQASNPYCITCNITSSSGNNIFVSSIYSPPSDPSPLPRLKCLFENMSSSDLSKLIICADLNAHSDLWSNASRTDLKGEEVEGVLFQYNMLVMNNPDSPPTFESSRGRSWIDLTICGHQVFDNLTNWRVNEEETLSLHKMIEFDIVTDLQVDPPVRYNYESTDWNLFNDCLSDNFASSNITPDNSPSDKVTLDKLVSEITSIFTKTIESCIKSSKNYKNRKLVSWWSKKLSDTRKSVNKARKTYQASKLPTDLENYRRIRNQYKYMIRNSKSENFKNFCKNTESPWDLLKKLTTSYRTPSVPTLKKDDGTYTVSDFDTCSYLLDKWFPDDDISSENEQHTQVRDTVMSFLNNGFTCPPPISEQELKIVHSISPLKASGSDLIKAIVLQNLSAKNLKVVKNIFSLCLKFGLFPTAWKRGEGIILPKPDRNDIENYKSYRGITLLSVFGKWFEKNLLKRLMYTDGGRIPRFSTYQFGFIPGKSCEEAICNIVFTVEKAFFENKYVLIICLDIAGAFDNVWPVSLLHSMISKGIDSSYIHVIKDYLSNRLIRLKLNNSSAEKHLTRSAPQGGGLSPFLWNCDFDDMLGEYDIDPMIFSNFVECYELENYVQAFADDNQIVIVSESLLLCQLAGNNILKKCLPSL